MKKRFILWLLVVSLGLVGAVSAHVAIDSKKDEVVLTEHILFGDRSIAEGLQVETHVMCNQQLFWDTTYTIREAPQTETRFRFSGKPVATVSDSTKKHESQGIDMNSDLNTGLTAKNIDFDDWQYSLVPSLTALKPIFLEVAKRAPVGETYLEEMRLRDYYEFYPLFFQFDLPAYYSDWSTGIESIQQVGDSNCTALNEVFMEFLKIPVDEKFRLEVIVTKASDGSVTHVEARNMKEKYVGFNSRSVVTEEACYFVLQPIGFDETSLDVSHIPGGYGIYRLPIVEEKGFPMVKAEQLSIVFPLDVQNKIDELSISADQSKLLLITTEELTSFLTVIDVASMKQVQKIPFLEYLGGDGNYLWKNYFAENYIVAYSGDNQLSLVTLNSQGEYEHQFTADITEMIDLVGVRFRGEETILWDGTLLSLVANTMFNQEDGRFCSFSVSLFSKEGLQFFGQYDSSLDVTPVDPNLACRPDPSQPLEMRWTP